MLLLISAVSDYLQVLGFLCCLILCQPQTYVAYCKHKVFRENQLVLTVFGKAGELSHNLLEVILHLPWQRTGGKKETERASESFWSV